MKNFELKNKASDAVASGRGLSSAPWMNCNKSSYNIKEVQDGGWQSGRSMIEMLGVLAIIGVLSVGGIAGYSKAMTKYRINKTIEQITLISGNIRSFFGQQKNYAEATCCGDSGGVCAYDGGCLGFSSINSSGDVIFVDNGCPIIKKAKIFPDEMLTLNSTGGGIMSITNPFGYGVGINSDGKSTKGDNQAFYITYYIGGNVEACIELLTQDWSAADVKVIEIDEDYFFKTPVAVDDAVTYCSTAGLRASAPSFPTIRFYFDIDLGGSYWNPKPRGAGGGPKNWLN